MIAAELTDVLSQSVSEVLETMYFTGVSGEEQLESNPGEEWVCTRLNFTGSRTGSLGVRAPLHTARILAESFLGAEPETITESQCLEVLGEMSNMVCGAVLSRLAHEEQFALSHPEAEPAGWNDAWHNHTAAVVFRLEEGAVAIWLDWETV